MASSRVDDAVTALATGRVIIVDDGTSAELVVAATYATTATTAFMVRHGSGFVSVALPPETCERLRLPPMHWQSDVRVTVDLVGTGTGISAEARAATIAALGAPESQATDFVRPGHVVPHSTHLGGVLEHARHAEAHRPHPPRRAARGRRVQRTRVA
ncbi:3,4-dihydroxy-2-butanone-4-phosphate synthase [Pseudonocardia sp. GCM10023141]|uniref:3,4-dihydroxy-2-butanone-4-phosphate synthase n=1 Tax=Pseudonocardia sp. GCM10023141 TaxID=3252653 RepID=UPI003608B935